MIRLGTSGFSYDDWVGPVYPAGLPRRAWLEHYAGLFDSVELNVTFYRVPDRRTVAGWVERTPEGFLFSVKAHRSLTHEREQADARGFLDGLAPLIESGRLACVLAQFPHSFHPGPATRAYLERLREDLRPLPAVVEFRDRAWADEATLADLQRQGLGFCCVDEPQLPGLMPPLARATASPAYVRFHGRNAERWWEHDHAWQRYDYTYRDDELREWIPRLRALDGQVPLTLVYANNHYRGQSVQTLRQLQRLLLEA